MGAVDAQDDLTVSAQPCTSMSSANYSSVGASEAGAHKQLSVSDKLSLSRLYQLKMIFSRRAFRKQSIRLMETNDLRCLVLCVI
jgi:gamma-glutamylcysteine synthetase